MLVFRLTRKRYANSLDGKGAAKSNNRWNSVGTELIYSSANRALAMAEVAVHLPLNILPKDYVMLSILIPDAISVWEPEYSLFPANWANNPPGKSSQQFGDLFFQENKYAVVRVPSAVVPGDFNYLINPYHQDFPLVKTQDITEFPFDRRFFKA